MLSARMLRTIEDHAEELTKVVLRDLETNPRTPSYRSIPDDELRRRVYDVYHNLGRWLGEKNEEPLEASYGRLGRTRCREGVRLSELVYALMLSKEHLHEYIRMAGLIDSALELYGEEELAFLCGRFFDRAIFYTIRGYESEAAIPASPASR
jgi:hypothetical protein